MTNILASISVYSKAGESLLLVSDMTCGTKHSKHLRVAGRQVTSICFSWRGLYPPSRVYIEHLPFLKRWNKNKWWQHLYEGFCAGIDHGLNDATDQRLGGVKDMTETFTRQLALRRMLNMDNGQYRPLPAAQRGFQVRLGQCCLRGLASWKKIAIIVSQLTTAVQKMYWSLAKCITPHKLLASSYKS